MADDERIPQAGRDRAGTDASPRILDPDELRRQVSALSGWTAEQQRLRRTVAVPADLVRPLLDAVARAERELDHHADTRTSEDGVTFTVWTHSLDAVTDLDVTLARRIDAAVAALGAEG